MTTNKDFKRVVRARMLKTGESYTAARSRLLHHERPVAAAAPTATSADYARLAGMSDETVSAKTGCTWEKWVWALDRIGATELSHREIAKYMHEKYKIPGWWAQTVTVGYERIRGLRDIGQRRGAGYEASTSKTIGVPIARLYRAFHDRRQRRRWLGDAQPTIRTAITNKSLRMTWDDGTSVEAYFVSKGASKTQVAVQHVKLPSKAAAARMKAYWTERLGALSDVLAASRPSRAGKARSVAG